MSIVMSQRNSAMKSLGGSIYSANGNAMKMSSSTFKYKDRDVLLGNEQQESSSSDSSDEENFHHNDKEQKDLIGSRDHSV